MNQLRFIIAAAMIVLPGVATAADADAGKTKAAQCAACHGDTGASENPQFPTIAGQYSEYIVQALRDYKSGKRANPIMGGLAAGLNEADMADLAAYFANQDGGVFTPTKWE